MHGLSTYVGSDLIAVLLEPIVCKFDETNTLLWLESRGILQSIGAPMMCSTHVLQSATSILQGSHVHTIGRHLLESCTAIGLSGSQMFMCMRNARYMRTSKLAVGCSKESKESDAHHLWQRGPAKG